MVLSSEKAPQLHLTTDLQEIAHTRAKIITANKITKASKAISIAVILGVFSGWECLAIAHVPIFIHNFSKSIINAALILQHWHQWIFILRAMPVCTHIRGVPTPTSVISHCFKLAFSIINQASPHCHKTSTVSLIRTSCDVGLPIGHILPVLWYYPGERSCLVNMPGLYFIACVSFFLFSTLLACLNIVLLFAFSPLLEPNVSPYMFCLTV